LKVEHKQINGFVQVKEIQKHPVNEKVLHLDFMIIDQTTSNLRMHIPLYYCNKDKSPGIKLGGFLKENSRSLEVKLASYDKLVAWLKVDLKGFEANQNLKLGNIEFPDGIVPIRQEITIATLMPSKGAES
jgi:large subunit ribosomal protein L25